jgi:hypothetical protein
MNIYYTEALNNKMNKLFLLCISIASAYNPGLTASLDRITFDQAKQAYTNLLLE